MATFGDTAVPSLFDNLAGDYAQVSRFTLGTAGTFTRLWMYMDGNGVGTGNQPCKALIYSDTAGPKPLNLLALSNEVTITDGQSAGWVEFTLTSPVDLTPTTYWLGFIAGLPTNAARRGYTSVLGNRRYEPDTYSDGPLNPWTDVGSGSDALQISIYAETAAASSATRSLLGVGT